MSEAAKTLAVVMFSGGRGTATICNALVQHPQISLTILVNTYDDGLSTGRLRRFIPGMLGPSDVRKNVSRLIPEVDLSDRSLKEIIEYRLPDPTSQDEGRAILKAACHSGEIPDAFLRPRFAELRWAQAQAIRSALAALLRYMERQDSRQITFDFSDCAFGNLIFSGCHLEESEDFNRAVTRFGAMCRSKGQVLNVTDGKNLVLVGLKDDGTLLTSEAQIVAPQSTAAILDIVLLTQYLTEQDASELRGLPTESRHQALLRRSYKPNINPEAALALERADVIIYGPGTQHSSLFPSYLTDRIAEIIAANRQAEKIFVSNIYRDHEIQSETVHSLTQKFFYYLTRRGEALAKEQDVVTVFLFQAPEEDAPSEKYLAAGQQLAREWKDYTVVTTNFESPHGSHVGGRVVDHIIRRINLKAQTTLEPFGYMVSIIVPCLNEARTVKGVLESLALLDFSRFGLSKEILFVDGGSTDESVKLAREVQGVKVLSLKGATGRGLAIRKGIESASGNIAVFFPSDGEYSPTDVISLVNGLVSGGFQAVYGSRLIKCVNLTQRIRDIYRGDWFGYWVSKWGGIALSIAGLVLFNRFISDSLTGLKAFDIHLLRALSLSGRRLELETEILAKLGKQGVFILEVPVDFRPRLKREGKKTTLLDGLFALFTMCKLAMLWKPTNSPSLFRPSTKKYPSERS